MAVGALDRNGLRSHFGEVKLPLRNPVTHILALNETKLDELVAKELSVVTSSLALTGFTTEDGPQSISGTQTL